MDVVALQAAKADAAKKYADYRSAPRTRLKQTPSQVLASGESTFTWTFSGLTNTGQDTDTLFGTRSIKGTTAGTGGYNKMDCVLPAAVDMTGKLARIWFKVDDPTRLTRMEVVLSNAGLTAYSTFRVTYNPATTEGARTFKTNEWVALTLPWTPASTTGGGVTRTAVGRVVVQPLDNAGAAPLTYWVNKIDAVADPQPYGATGVCTLTFDDSYVQHYTQSGYLDRYGFRGTLFPILERIDSDGGTNWATTAQYNALVFQKGWEVGAHATTAASHTLGVNAMTATARRDELLAIKQWQAARGYQSESFAYPNGTWDSATVTDLRPLFSSSRLAGGYLGPWPNQAHAVGTYGIGGVPLATAKAAVDTAVANGFWLPILFHNIVSSGATGNDWLLSDFQALMDYLNTSGIAVRTMSEVIHSYAA